MTTATQNDHDMLLQAYCDAALDPASAAEFERQLSGDGTLRARHDQIMNLRRMLQSLPRAEAPLGLHNRITSLITVNRPRQRSWSWQALAASAMLGMVLTGSIAVTFDHYRASQEIARKLVASHIRGLLAPQPFDIASSDRHTVKPWFTTRMPESPQVIDLAANGFTLAGGRVDVLDRDPVATVVYRRASHVVSLTTLPAGRVIPGQIISGYNVLCWTDNVFNYVAVSDLPREELSTFERAFSTAATAG
jgi:anti-sigma factor RsiW